MSLTIRDFVKRFASVSKKIQTGMTKSLDSRIIHSFLGKDQQALKILFQSSLITIYNLHNQ